MDGWTNGWMKGEWMMAAYWMDDGQREKRQIKEQMMVIWTEGWMNEEMDGWLNGWIDDCMDRLHRQKGQQIN